MYIKPNGDNNGHLIYDLLRDIFVVTMNYQSVPVPEYLIEPMNRTKSTNNVDHFDIKQSMVRVDYSKNNKYKIQTPNNNENYSEDGNTDELGNSQHLDDLISDKIVDHEEQVIMKKRII